MNDPYMKIGRRYIGNKCEPYVIAEACINHEGQIDLAKEMVIKARAAGSHAIKFQFHVLEDEMLKETPQSDNFEESLWDALKRTNLTVEEHIELKEFCSSLGIDYLCTPFSKASADILHEKIGVDIFKVGSGELTNIPLQLHIASKGKPMIVSTGMSTVEEIDATVKALKSVNAQFALTHCVSIYPCPHDKLNIDLIPFYKERYGVPVGLSDHCADIYGALGAVAVGACILEKHLTLDKTAPGPDHASSIEPHELQQLVEGSKAVYLSKGATRVIHPEEAQIVAWARESVVSEVGIPANSVITADMVTVKRPAPGDGAIAAAQLDDVIGQTTKVAILKDRQILWEELQK